MSIAGLMVIGGWSISKLMANTIEEPKIIEEPKQVKNIENQELYGVSLAVDYDNKVDMKRFKDEDYIIPEIPKELLENIQAEETVVGVNKFNFHRLNVEKIEVIHDGIKTTLNDDKQILPNDYQGMTYPQTQSLFGHMLEGDVLTKEDIVDGTNSVIIPSNFAEYGNVKVGDSLEITTAVYSPEEYFGKEERPIIATQSHTVEVKGIYDVGQEYEEYPMRYTMFTSYDYVDKLFNEDEALRVENGHDSNTEEIAHRTLIDETPFYLDIYFNTAQEREAFIQKYEEQIPVLYSFMIQ